MHCGWALNSHQRIGSWHTELHWVLEKKKKKDMFCIMFVIFSVLMVMRSIKCPTNNMI